jgi:acyl-CoA synthetase (AMP-forming)/AMP-acid ligase II
VASPEANLSVLLTRAAATHPGNTAIRLDQLSLTYAELDEAVGRAAERLRARGVGPGDRVGLMLPNVPEFAVLYYAVLRIGAVVVPLNPLLKAREIEYHLSDSEASLLLVWPDCFRIVDRKKEMIIRGGFNVYPREIEEVLHEHPDVAEAAVLGVPDPALGEEVAACVALKQGAVTTPDELRDFVKSRVAPDKYPRRVWLVDALPKGPTGKILKREIQHQL